LGIREREREREREIVKARPRQRESTRGDARKQSQAHATCNGEHERVDDVVGGELRRALDLDGVRMCARKHIWDLWTRSRR
jgi:hypothetical protein